MNKQTLLLLLTAALAATITVSALLTLNKSPLSQMKPPAVPQYPSIPCLHFSSSVANFWTTPYLYTLDITNQCDTSYRVSYFDGVQDENSRCIQNDGKSHSTPLYDGVDTYVVEAC